MEIPEPFLIRAVSFLKQRFFIFKNEKWVLNTGLSDIYYYTIFFKNSIFKKFESEQLGQNMMKKYLSDIGVIIFNNLKIKLLHIFFEKKTIGKNVKT